MPPTLPDDRKGTDFSRLPKLLATEIQECSLGNREPRRGAFSVFGGAFSPLLRVSASEGMTEIIWYLP